MYGLPLDIMYTTTVLEKGRLAEQLTQLDEILRHGIRNSNPPRLAKHETAMPDADVLMCELNIEGKRGLLAFLASDVL